MVHGFSLLICLNKLKSHSWIENYAQQMHYLGMGLLLEQLLMVVVNYLKCQILRCEKSELNKLSIHLFYEAASYYIITLHLIKLFIAIVAFSGLHILIVVHFIPLSFKDVQMPILCTHSSSYTLTLVRVHFLLHSFLLPSIHSFIISCPASLLHGSIVLAATEG